MSDPYIRERLAMVHHALARSRSHAAMVEDTAAVVALENLLIAVQELCKCLAEPVNHNAPPTHSAMN